VKQSRRSGIQLEGDGEPTREELREAAEGTIALRIRMLDEETEIEREERAA
jgi:hypothetical protein